MRGVVVKRVLSGLYHRGNLVCFEMIFFFEVYCILDSSCIISDVLEVYKIYVC